jgi:peptidyl-tRNA hydrolase
MTTNIKDYSTTQANNTSLNGIDVNEGMLPSNLNNAIRALMKNTRDWFNSAEWIEYGDGSGAFTAAYASATSFTIAGADVTSVYHAGRRIKLTAATPGTIFGTISSSSFSTNTTVNVTWDSGSLASEAITNVYVGALSKTNSSIPEGIVVTATLADGSVTNAKLGADSVNGSKIADDSIDSEHYVDGSIDTAHIANSQITVDKMAVNSVNSDQYVDGSIDLIHLSADSVDGTKIADDSINSEHYVDGSIDTAHIANSQITLDKMASDSVNSSKIVDGSIVNADINASAAIDATKIADGSVTSTEFQYINTLSSNAQTQLDAKVVKASNLSDLASASTSRTNLGLGTIATQDANNVSVSGGSITGLGSPSASSDAATKNYVDQAVAGLRTRIIAECATTANVNLTNGLEAGDTIDGVTLVAGDRVLVKDQSTASENGLYLAVSSGAASRDPEHDTIAELSGGMVVVNQGSTNDNKIFLCTTDNTGSVGSTSITYSQVTPQNNGTVTSVGIADGGSSEFTVGSSPVTSSGNITLTVNSIAHTKISGLGTAATQTVGTSANNVVQLNGSAQLPAVDGSNLTNLSAASAGFAVAMAIAL